MKKLLFSAAVFLAGLIGYVTAQTTGITVSNVGYTSAVATITFSEADKAAVAAADQLMAVASPYDEGSLMLQDKEYHAGDIIWVGSTRNPVVYAAQPALADGSTLTLDLVFPENTADSYLWLYTGKKTENGATTTWTYTKLAVSAEPFQPKKPEIKISDLTYTSMKLAVTLNEAQAAADAVLIVYGPSLGVTHNNGGRQYQVGNRTGGAYPTTVIYSGKPELTDNSFTLDITDLNLGYGEDNYIMLCLGTQTNNTWSYTDRQIYTKFKTKQLNVTASEVEYSTFKASIALDDKMKATYAAAGSIVAFTSPNTSEIIRHDNNASGTRYKIGDQVANRFPVVFEGKPDLTADGKLEFTCIDLRPGSTVCLYVCLGTETRGKWNYATNAFAQSEEKVRMKSIPAPTGLQAGPASGGTIPLTITVEEPTAIMIVKSAAAQNIWPKGKLSQGDRYDNYRTDEGETLPEMINSGTVEAILAPGVQTYNLPMAAGEACYIHAYTVANPETEDAAYAPAMVMTPVYRMAEKLPLSYTFSVNDYITQAADRMPILPPGLGTTTVPTEDDDITDLIFSAFSVQMLQSENDNQYLLWSTYPATGNRWVDWVTPEFTGVRKVQAVFKTMLLTSSGYNQTSRQAANGDEVRIDYSVNGGDWQEAKTFTYRDFPAQEGSFYNLTADCGGFQRTDVVRLRYSYRSTVSSTKLTLSSYEIQEFRDCLAPINLQAVTDHISNDRITLTWEDQNMDGAASFMVYYENAAFPEANGVVGVTGSEATIGNLMPGTTYNVRVQAVCGRDDSSFFSAAQHIATLHGLPYRESMATEKSSGVILKMPDVNVYAQADLKDKTTWKAVEEFTNVEKEDALATGSWDAYWCSTGDDGVYYSMGIPANTDQALMLSPVIFIPTATPVPAKTLTFKANPYKLAEGANPTPEHNADLPENIRLYVLASTDGFATWDTVGEYDHTALSAGNTTTADGNPGKTFSLPMDKYQGKLQLGFYFRAPLSGTATATDGFLEIHSVELDYNQRFQPYDLTADATEDSAVINWKGDGDLYRIYYALKSAENYTDSVDVAAAPGTMSQSVILRGLKDDTDYKVGIVSYAAGYTKASAMATTAFTTLVRMYTVTAIVTPEDGGTVTGTGRYFLGRTARLTATPNDGYRFTGWEAGGEAISDASELRINMTKDTTVTAVFEKIPEEPVEYTLTLTANPAEGGKVEGAGSFEADADVTIKATPNEGYKFVAWKNGGNEVSKEAEYTFKMPASDTAFTAIFEKVSGSANEALLRAAFQLSTADGQLYIRNLKGITITDIDVHTLNGQRIHRFLPNSDEDLILPVDARRAILFIRLNSAEGTVIYKVFMQ